MKKTILAFPLPAAVDAALPFLSERLHLRLPAGAADLLMIPGCPVSFTGKLQGPAAGLDDVFADHFALTDAERCAIKAHGSLFFLQCSIRKSADFDAVNKVILQFLDAGVPGVYMEQSGCAWSAAAFRAAVADALPMEAWLNFIAAKGNLCTLGMESFGFPDLSVSLASGDMDGLKNVLSCVADALFRDGLEVDTGTRWNDGEGNDFEFRKEQSALYRKGDFEYNALGLWKLLKK